MAILNTSTVGKQLYYHWKIKLIIDVLTEHILYHNECLFHCKKQQRVNYR